MLAARKRRRRARPRPPNNVAEAQSADLEGGEQVSRVGMEQDRTGPVERRAVPDACGFGGMRCRRPRRRGEHRFAGSITALSGRLIAAPVAARAPRRRENPAACRALVSTATGIRTPVSAVRGRCPSPLDDGGSSGGEDSRGAVRAWRGGIARAGSERVSSSAVLAAVAELVDAHGSGPCGAHKSPWRFESSQPHDRGAMVAAGTPTSQVCGCSGTASTASDGLPHRSRSAGP
jgi:hypothetical protein